MTLTCVFLWASMFARLADRNIGIDKDWLFLYLCGIETVQPQLHEQQVDLVRRIVAASGDDQVVYRATMRANYCNNYPFTSLSMYLAGKWQTWLDAKAAEDFPSFLTRSLFYGVIVSGGLLGIIALLTIFALAQGPLRIAMFLAIGLAAAFYLTIPPPVTSWFLYQGTNARCSRMKRPAAMPSPRNATLGKPAFVIGTFGNTGSVVSELGAAICSAPTEVSDSEQLPQPRATRHASKHWRAER